MFLRCFDRDCKYYKLISYTYSCTINRGKKSSGSINLNRCKIKSKKASLKSAKSSNNLTKNHIDNAHAEFEMEEKLGQSAVPDLSNFKFEKKPHIKIQYDSNSPSKEDANGLWEPPNWKDFLLNLRIMRANQDAPVDSMGCHMSMDQNASPEVIRYQSLISLMLSSQTKDQVTFAAMERLRSRGLTIDNVLKMSDEELGQLIYPVGFWKTKVKYIKKTTQTLKDQYNGDIPDSVEKLCKLTGVGPKMAHICMKVAWNKVTGIGVDTHVHRISNRIGWVKKQTATPEDTRKALQTWLPFDLWSEVNHLMVGFGQTICLPIGPTCHECLNRDICPSSGLGKKSPKKSPNKANVSNNDDFEVSKAMCIENEDFKSESLNIKKSKQKNELTTEKSPLKRKVTPKKEPETEVEGQSERVATKSSKIKTIKKELSEQTKQESACVKRKSPRSKTESEMPKESTTAIKKKRPTKAK